MQEYDWLIYKVVGKWLWWKDVEHRALIVEKRRVTCTAEMVYAGHHETLAPMRDPRSEPSQQFRIPGSKTAGSV
ncbi:hypothetical protein VNO80_12771 [Phaseolus coccineus]|uniref:Uncharacterized protein n=1 Tax=Phaseolus coccineus TaxID=3886 RepID=A0AAN9R6J2_PHACN